MVTGDQELQWAYLLCPTFELSNSEGKPLTNGYIELYIAGTRDKYYAASDFNGTLHPFQIPLDSLGANIVLVNPGQAYDVYVYNRFGNLIMSRYNVTAVGAGSGSGNSNFTIDSTDGTVVVTTSTDPETGVKTYDLSVPSVSGDASYWMGRGAATMGVNIEDTEYHDIQISSNSIRNEGEDIEVLDGKFSLKEGVYFWSVTVQLDKFESFDNTRQKVYVESTYNRGVYTMDMTHDESETVTFSGITVADHDGDTEGFKIKSEGTSPIRATLYHVAIHKLNHNIIGEGTQGKTYTGGDYIQITDDDVINVTGLPNVEEVEDMIESAITATASGYVYTAGDYISIDNREISVTGLQPEGDYATNAEVNEATVTAIQAATAVIPDTEEVQFEELDITQFAQVSAITGLASKTEVYEATVTAIQAATGEIPEPLEAGDYVSIVDNTINVTGLQPEGDYLTQEDLEGYATETYVDNSVTAFVDGDTVSAIVTNMVTAMLPPELPLVAGDGITITETEDHIEIAANVTSIEGYATESYVTAYVDNSVSSFVTEEQVTAMLPDTEEVQFEELDITQFAQATAIPIVTGFATRDEVYEAVVTGVQAATSEIPDVSDFTTHAEVNESAVTSIQLVTGLIPDVSDFTTHTEVYESTVTAIEAATAVIPDTEEVQFEEINLSDYALATAIPVVTGYATHTEVHDATVTAIETVTAMIPEAQVQSDWIEDDTESPAYIQNKPDESLLVAGNGIEITESNNTIVISANVTSIDGYAKIEDVYDATVTAVQTATGAIPDVSDFTTHAEVYDTAVTAIQLVTGMIPDDYTTHTEVHEATVTAIEAATAAIPDTEEVQFEELDITQFAMASAVTGFATEVDLIEAVSAVTGIGDYGQFYATDITGAATMSKAKGTIDVTNDGKIMLKQGQSYHVTVRGRYVQGTAANTYTAVSYIEYVTNNGINFNVDKTKTESQYFELSYDLYKLNSDTNYYIFFTGVDGLIKDLFIEIHAIGSVGVGQGGGGGAEYDAGWGIRILNNVISVNPDIVATVTGVEALIQNVTATIPSAQVQSDWTEDDSTDPSYIQNKPAEKQLLAGANVTITSTATSVIISADGSGDVTEAMLYDATVTAVQTATGLIPDVPDVKNVVAGENITITENATAIVISSTGGGGGGSDITEAEVYDATVTAVQAATALIPDVSDMATKTWVGNQGYLTSIPSTYATDSEVYNATVTAVQVATGLIPDTSDMATKTWVGNQGYLTSIPSSYATDTEVYEATVTAVQMATGAIPAQVQSDWTVTAVDDPAYIDNKPEIVEMEILTVSAGNGISIETNATGMVISATEIASGLQLIAGDNINMSVTGNNLVISAAKGLDETVLYTASSAADSITTTEEVTNFERLRIELQSAQSTYVKNCLECKPDANNLVYTGTALIPAAVYPLQIAGVRYTSSNAKNFSFSSATRMCYKPNSTYGDSTTTSFASSDIKDVGFITKIVGINRIS